MENLRAMQAAARWISVAWASPEDRPMLEAARLALDPMLPTMDYGNSYLPEVDM